MPINLDQRKHCCLRLRLYLYLGDKFACGWTPMDAALGPKPHAHVSLRATGNPVPIYPPCSHSQGMPWHWILKSHVNDGVVSYMSPVHWIFPLAVLDICVQGFVIAATALMSGRPPGQLQYVGWEWIPCKSRHSRHLPRWMLDLDACMYTGCEHQCLVYLHKFTGCDVCSAACMDPMFALQPSQKPKVTFLR